MSLKCLHNCDNLMFSGLLYHELESAKLRAYVLHNWLHSYVLACLACLRACVLNVLECLACLAHLACLRAHVFGAVTCFISLSTWSISQSHACCAQISYVLTCLRASLASFVPLSLHLKSQFQKVLYRGISFYSEKCLEPTLASVNCKKF